MRGYFEHFVQILIDHGFSPDPIFSHQMAPNLYGAWNSDLIAIDAMTKNLGWTRYGVNEMHPIVVLEPEQYREIFEHHYRNGAAFLAPYFVSMQPDPPESVAGLHKYLISSTNPRCGSDYYWRSLVSIMKR